MDDLSLRHHLFAAAHRRGGLTVQQLWLRYFALTGSCGVFEVDAFLHGLTAMPPVEQNILAHALNERLADLYRATRVPYLSPDVPTVKPEDPLTVVHQLLHQEPLPSTKSGPEPLR